MAAPYRLPKTLWGVRIPKKLRKSKLIDWLLNDPIGRNLLADALVAAAGAAAAALTRNPPQPVRRGVRETVEGFGSVLTGAAGHLFSEEERAEHHRKKKKRKARDEAKERGEDAHFSRH